LPRDVAGELDPVLEPEPSDGGARSAFRPLVRPGQDESQLGVGQREGLDRRDWILARRKRSDKEGVRGAFATGALWPERLVHAVGRHDDLLFGQRVLLDQVPLRALRDGEYTVCPASRARNHRPKEEAVAPPHQ
jgi:hypothetical protein